MIVIPVVGFELLELWVEADRIDRSAPYRIDSDSEYQ